MRHPERRFTGPALGLVFGLVLGFAPFIGAETGKPCSNATLNGSFGFYRTGSTPAGTLAAVGIITFDGHGHADATQSISRGGDYAFDVEFPGLYEIDADCTGKGLTTDGDEFVRLVVVDGGRGLLMFSESPGNAVYGVGTKIARDNQ